MNNQKQIASKFLSNTGSIVEAIEPINHGLINSTFKVQDDNNNFFILQKINSSVFKNPFDLAHNLLILDQNINTCNIELRPKGIIVRFRSLLETYGLIIPYYKLKIYKGKSQEYSIYLDHYFVKILADSSDVHKFVKKINRQKALNSPPNLEDL